MTQSTDNPTHSCAPGGRRVVVPSWLASVALHAVTLIGVALLLQLAPEKRGAPGDRTAEGGIALKHVDGDEEFFETEETANLASDIQTTAMPSIDQVLADQPSIDTAGALPSTLPLIGPSLAEQGGLPSASGATEGTTGGNSAGQGKARVSVFGAEGEGFRFVYVFDKSGSMDEGVPSLLEAAKAELIHSLDSLERTHQFQIIFYNERPQPFNPSGVAGRLAFANEQNKERARRFVAGVTAGGGTKPEPALMMALGMQPDVVFFLADSQALSEAMLYRVGNQAPGVQINAIEFGYGPPAGQVNLLKRIARLHGGQYVYKDVRDLLQGVGGRTP